MHACRFAFLTYLACVQVSSGARVFFTDQPNGGAGSIISVAPDGTGQQPILTIPANAGPNLRGIGFHRASGRIFFVDDGVAKRIYSILADGSSQQEIAPIDATLTGSDLEIDDVASKVYWSESNGGNTGNGLIRRANLNGTELETAVMTDPGLFTTPYFIFLDPAASNIYWGVLSTGSSSSMFRRATYDGVIDPNFSITSPTRTRDIAVDFATGTAYWTDRQTGTIFRRALAGGLNEVVIDNMNAPHGIALDLEARKIYWADTGQRGSGPFSTSARRVARCNFDGTDYENISSPESGSEAWDLALDTSSTNYTDWRTRFFMATAPNAGPNDDADADGAANLLEYAMGTHPGRVGSVPRLVAEPAGLRYSRRRVSNLNYRVEVSTNLTVWHHNFEGSGQIWTTQTSVTPISPDLETVTVTRGAALNGAPQAFFRLRVAAP